MQPESDGRDLRAEGTGALSAIASSRGAVVVASLLYAAALHLAHARYLGEIWGYYGFTYNAPGGLEALATVLLVMLGGILLPPEITKPSSVIVILLYAVVYLPTVVITLSLDANSLARYGLALAMLGLAFGVVCRVAGAASRAPESAPGARTAYDAQPLGTLGAPDRRVAALLVGLWAICGAVLLLQFGSVMRFGGFADVYEQRAAGASTSASIGYAQTYFSNVLSPGLIAFGLVRSRTRFVALGALGCLMSFSIDAQRTVLLLPLAVVGVHYALTSRRSIFRASSSLLVLLASTVSLLTAFADESLFVFLLSAFTIFRGLGLPGLAFSQYSDLFGTDGYTWWSHVKGVSLLVPAPAAYAKDPAWPNLGYIVGDRVYGNVANNANANLFAGDGVAAAGPLGVAVIGILLAFYLSWLDRASRGWDRRFAVLVVIPVGIALTNGHLFTTLLSFGGLFWMLLFHLCRPAPHGFDHDAAPEPPRASPQ